MNNKKKFTLEEIKKMMGQYVEVEQLSEIRDIMVLVAKNTFWDTGGTIEFIGEWQSNDAAHVWESGKVIHAVYKKSVEDKKIPVNTGIELLSRSNY